MALPLVLITLWRGSREGHRDVNPKAWSVSHVSRSLGSKWRHCLVQIGRACNLEACRSVYKNFFFFFINKVVLRGNRHVGPVKSPSLCILLSLSQASSWQFKNNMATQSLPQKVKHFSSTLVTDAELQRVQVIIGNGIDQHWNLVPRYLLIHYCLWEKGSALRSHRLLSPERITLHQGALAGRCFRSVAR